MFLLTILVLVLTSFGLYYYVEQKHNFWKSKKIKFAKPKFFVGNMELYSTKSFTDKIHDIYKSFPGQRYCGFYQFLQPRLLIRDPELIKKITIKHFDHFMNHPSIVDEKADLIWSKGLFASRDQKWKKLKLMLTPSFTACKIKFLYGLIEECAQNFLVFLEKHQETLIELELKDTLRRVANDVIASTAFGIKCDSLNNRHNKFFETGKQFFDFRGFKALKFFILSISPGLGKILKIKLIPDDIGNFFSEIIRNNIDKRRKDNIVRPDIIHLMMQTDSELTSEEIISQAMVFYLAGFETVSILLGFTFYELALNPEIQNRLRKEIETVFDLNYEYVQEFEYLDAVVSESLRKWCPVNVVDREVSKDFFLEPKGEENPQLLKKGEVCVFPIFEIHRDPLFFPNPEKFDPERFNSDNRKKIKPGTFIPFGQGPRVCLGSRLAILEAKLVIVHVLKNYEIVKIAKTLDPMILDKHEINISAEGGMWLGFKRIN